MGEPNYELIGGPVVYEDYRKYILVFRTERHPKGQKLLAVIPEGGSVPAGIIIGKGAHMLIFNTKNKAFTWWRDFEAGLEVMPEPKVKRNP